MAGSLRLPLEPGEVPLCASNCNSSSVTVAQWYFCDPHTQENTISPVSKRLDFKIPLTTPSQRARLRLADVSNPKTKSTFQVLPYPLSFRTFFSSTFLCVVPIIRLPG